MLPLLSQLPASLASPSSSPVVVIIAIAVAAAMAAVCDASIEATCCATQDRVTVLNAELVKCMATRAFQTAMMLKVRPCADSLVSSQAGERVDWITLIQAHWPSSAKRRFVSLSASELPSSIPCLQPFLLRSSARHLSDLSL